MLAPPRRSTLFPYTTLFRSEHGPGELLEARVAAAGVAVARQIEQVERGGAAPPHAIDVGEPRLAGRGNRRSEEHTSELQSLTNLVCRLLLEKKKTLNKHPVK